MKLLSLAEAKLSGAKWYFTGKPCKQGHVAERIVSSRCCKECSYIKTTAYQQANQEKMRENFKVWRAANLDRDREASRTWQKNNRDRVIATIAKREADIDHRTPKWADIEKIRAVYSEAKRLTLATGVPYHVDHEIPLRGKLVSGLHVHTNLRPIPADQNKKKSNSFSVDG